MPQISDYFNQPQDWVWGQGASAGVKIDPKSDRLLSPDEFDKLANRVRVSYGGYMGYLKAYAQQQKAKRDIPAAYEAVKAGTYEIPETGVVSYGGSTTASARGRIPTAGAKGAAGAGIPTTIHRDISGRPTQELAGAGIRRGMGGEVIPQTAEQVGAQMRLDRAVPTAAMEADIDFLGTLARKKELESTIAFNKRQEAAAKLGQAQQRIEQGSARIEQGQQRLDDQNERFQRLLGHREYIVKVQQLGRESLMKMGNVLKTENAELKNEYAKNMSILKGEVPGTAQSKLKHEEASARIIDILNAKAKIDATDEQRKETSRLLNEQNKFNYWLRQVPIKQTLMGRQDKARVLELVKTGQWTREQAKAYATEKGWDRE